MYKRDDLFYALYSRRARDPKDMASGMWAALENRAKNDWKYRTALDLPGIYRLFTASLMQATNALSVLVCSAMPYVRGQPSWVLDWAAHDRHEWRDRVGDVDARDDYENDLTRSFSIFKESLMAVGLRSRVSTEDVSKGQPLVPYFGIDETQSVLVVRACHLATIS
jgi:hypothetical protein